MDGVDQQHDELVVLVQQQGHGKVPDPLLQQRGLPGKLDGVDVAKRDLVAQHLAVDQPHQQLLHQLGRDVGRLELLLQHLHLPSDDAVLLVVGPALADGPDEAAELLGRPVRHVGALQLAADKLRQLLGRLAQLRLGRHGGVAVTSPGHAWESRLPRDEAVVGQGHAGWVRGRASCESAAWLRSLRDA